MWEDPILEELHRIREEHAKSFNSGLTSPINNHTDSKLPPLPAPFLPN
jgi:hypothetical protein